MKPNRDLCIMACVFCKEPEFHKWMTYRRDAMAILASKGLSNEDAAKEFILQTCGIISRNELDRYPTAADLFHERIRKPYLAWKEGR